MKKLLLITLCMLGAAGSSWAQEFSSTQFPDPRSGLPLPHNTGEFAVAAEPSRWEGDGEGLGRPLSLASRWYASQEYLLIRTHFSEALAFARADLAGAPANVSVRAEELDFDYESSFRTVLGYHWNNCTDIRFRYWHLDVDTTVPGTAGPTEIIVDPYGGFAAAGESIAATAAVEMNIYDLEVVRPINLHRPNLGLDYSAGLRFADVEQFSDSTIRTGGAIKSRGEFAAEFFGVGPYVSLTGKASPANHPRFSLLSKWGMALLVGQYDVSTQMTVPGVQGGGQRADRTRLVPVAEAELGGQWRATDYLTLSAGWLVQGWWNLGASGGTFDGENTPLAPMDAAFVGTDDADIMSFDAVFLRGEVEF